MFGHLKQYTSLALCALLLNIAVCLPTHVMATQEAPTQDETAQSVENATASNEQSDGKEIHLR